MQIQNRIGASDMTLELGKPVTTETEVVTLTEVKLATKAGVAIPESSYEFTFEIKKR